MDDRDADMARLETLKQYGVLDTSPEAVFDGIVREAALLTGASISTITMIDADRQWFKAKQGVERDGDPLSESICAVAMNADGAFVVGDASTDDRFSGMRAVTVDGIRFYAGVPLVVRDGERLGTLCVIDMAARDGLGDDERAALTQLARRTVAALEARRDLLGEHGESPTPKRWLDRARTQLDQAAAALAELGESTALAQLETVIATVDAIDLADRESA